MAAPEVGQKERRRCTVKLELRAFCVAVDKAGGGRGGVALAIHRVPKPAEPRLEPPPLLAQGFDFLLCRPAVLPCNIPLTSRLVALPLHQVKGEEG